MPLRFGPLINAAAVRQHERNHFVREGERWFYVDGDMTAQRLQTVVDTTYRHPVDSALAGVCESVSDRVGLTLSTPLRAPTGPGQTPAQAPGPKLRVISRRTGR